VIPPLIQVAIGTIDTVTELLASFPGETFDFTWPARSEMVHLMLRDAAYGTTACGWPFNHPLLFVAARPRLSVTFCALDHWDALAKIQNE
jgi:hypothetical protein